MKRVLIFSLAYYPHVGGAEVALKEITDRIPNIEFHMVTLNFGAEAAVETIGNIVVHRIGRNASYLSKILFVPRAALAARALHRASHFDAFWAMMSYMLFPIVLLRLWGITVPYALSLQEGDPFEHVFKRPYIKVFSPLLRSGFKHATVVQAISTFLGNWASRIGYSKEAVIIPNGVDLNRFAHAQPNGIEKNKGDVWLIHTGRLVHKNALDTVIRALSLLPPHIHFFMIGDGPDKKALIALAEKERVDERVHFHPYVAIEELPGYLKACDTFIRPSRSEGMGNSFIEAMAAGLPVIATQEGGISDFLFDAKRNPDKSATGWAVDVDSPEQIAGAVRDIIAHPYQTGVVTANARKLVTGTYEWNVIASQMEQKVFQPLLNN